jgi:succinate dehydrogenase / fumarate reductase membrane anchor subunit
MKFHTDRSRADGLGSAKEGTDHWWQQRVTAVALIPLGVLFVFPLATIMGDGHAAVLAHYGHPLNAIIAGLFMLVAFNHLRLGLQVVLEDYVHGAMFTIMMMATTLFCGAFAFAGIFAIAKIAFQA